MKNQETSSAYRGMSVYATQWKIYARNSSGVSFSIAWFHALKLTGDNVKRNGATVAFSNYNDEGRQPCIGKKQHLPL